MKITGQILKENRERKGVTLNEVSLSTKITIKTLVSIEEGDPATLPPKTFLRGFVRSYAIFLGLDVEEILRTFHEEMGSTLSRPVSPTPNLAEMNAAATEAAATTPTSETSVAAETPTGEAPKEPVPFVERRAHPRVTKKIDAEATLRDEPSLMTKGGIVGGILILVILIVFLKGKMDSYESERNQNGAAASVETADSSQTTNPDLTDGALTAEETAAGAQTETGDSSGENGEAAAAVVAPTASPTPTATPVATPTPTPKPSATPVPTPTPKPSATPSPTPTPKPSPSATPSPTPKPTATPTPAPTATPSAAASPTPKPLGPAPDGKSHEILIEALDGVDVEVTVDGEAPRTIKLRGEQVQSIKVKRKAVLKLSDGGAVNLIVNGIDRGVPGDLGKPTRVELP